MRSAYVLLTLSMAATSVAQSRPIDTAASTLTVHAYKSGVFSFAGHDHTIRATIASGTLDPSNRAIEFSVSAKDMQVLDPSESDKNKMEIRSTMLGPKLLDSDKYPQILFRSTAIRQLSTTSFEVQGELTLHGIALPPTMKVTRDGDRYVGQTKVKQSDYGLTPVSVAGGTIKVKDEVMVEFSVK